jgi:hypothetical protein
MFLSWSVSNCVGPCVSLRSVTCARFVSSCNRIKDVENVEVRDISIPCYVGGT